MEMSRLQSSSCCHDPPPLKNLRKRRDQDAESHSKYLSKAKGLPKRGQGLSLQTFVSGAHHPDSSAAYLIWPPSARDNGSAEDRANYFAGLQKTSQLERDRRLPGGHQATTLLDLMTIRAFHTKALRRYSLGTALGFRTRGGVLTNIPAILVFVGRKVHEEWLLDVQKLPSALEGPGGVWCDVDVVEFSYYGTHAVPSREQLDTELVEGLRGNDPAIGAGSQVASQETYGTLGGLVRSRTAGHQLGFLTNRHVAVDLDYPDQKMFHPLPPSLGPGVYLGTVERATSFITDDLWYGVFAGMNPETFVRADGAFVPFAETFDLTKVTATLKGVGDMGEVMRTDLQAPIDSVIGKQVIKVGRSSGLTKGVIMGYAVEYNDERGVCYFTDFLVVGENGQPFDLEGDSGSLILLSGPEYDKPRPFGIIWGGTANRGRLKLRNGHGPENWTSGVDLGRLLDLLQLELITNTSTLAAAVREHRRYRLRADRLNGDVLPERFKAEPRMDNGKAKAVVQFRIEGHHECGHAEASENFLEHIAGSMQANLSPVCRRPSLSESEALECNLSLGGAPAESLASSSKQEGKVPIDEDVQLGLGLGGREPKRRCLP